MGRAVSSISVLLYAPGRERPTLRRCIENTLKLAGLREGDELLIAPTGSDAAAWAQAQGWNPAEVRLADVQHGPSEGATRNAMAAQARGDLLVWLDDADLFYGNGVQVLRASAEERPGHAVLAFRQGRAGAKDRMVVALRGQQGDWLSPAGYLQDTLARHGGIARTIQAVVYLVRPFPEKW